MPTEPQYIALLTLAETIGPFRIRSVLGTFTCRANERKDSSVYEFQKMTK